MNPLMLLPLLAAGCVAAPAASLAIHGAALPYAVGLQHQVTAHVPAGVEYKQVGDVLPVGHAVAPLAVPGYSVNGEVRQISQEFAAPPEVKVDVNALPTLAVHGSPVAYAAAGAPAIVAAPAHAVVAPAAVAPLTYSNVNLNVPAPVPAGEAPAPEVLVQRIPVKALGRPVVSYTPQITEVRPELRIIEKNYDVAVPKPVYETREVTPIQHQYVPEPYTVHRPYVVRKPVAVPTPVNVPVAVPQPIHYQHNIVAQPTLAHVGYGATPVAHQQYFGAPAIVQA